MLVAGDVVQINGKRPPYVAEARRDAKRASKALSDAVGLPVPVTPVLTFVGSGVISVYGLPKDCLVATHRELDRLLVAGGSRISPATAEKLSRVAQHPGTWLNGTYRSSRRLPVVRARAERPLTSGPTAGNVTGDATRLRSPVTSPVSAPSPAHRLTPRGPVTAVRSVSPSATG